MFRPYLEFALISPQQRVVTMTTVVTQPTVGYQSNSGVMGEQAILGLQPLISGNNVGYQTYQTASSTGAGAYYQPNPGLYQQQGYPLQQPPSQQLPLPLYPPDNIANNFNQVPQQQNDPPIVYYQQQQKQTSNKDYQKF